MNFKFDIETTKNILFKPSTIELFILDKETIDNQEIVNIQTILTQKLPTGQVIESTIRKFPIAILNIINGFDIESLNPTVDLEQLNTILSNFDLKTI